MKKKIVVEIECRKKYCSRCRELIVDAGCGYCHIFDTWVINGENGWLRLSECVKSEN